MNDQDLRDCFAMFAMNGLFLEPDSKLASHDNYSDWHTHIAKQSYEIADAMLEARRVNEEPQGIVAIKKRRGVK
jgi:hypothetical protein